MEILTCNSKYELDKMKKVYSNYIFERELEWVNKQTHFIREGTNIREVDFYDEVVPLMKNGMSSTHISSLLTISNYIDIIKSIVKEYDKYKLDVPYEVEVIINDWDNGRLLYKSTNKLWFKLWKISYLLETDEDYIIKSW
ncbi:MAG: hypothetical protein ACRDBY_12830 [Cetobacterium sp.]